jgi:putative SOS response-associated peptidase YedK
MINARADTAATRPAIRKAFRQRRWLIVADGFCEWKKLNGRKEPYYIRLQDGQPFDFAGLWERWNRGDSPIDSCTILTTDASELVGSIHDRMPVILNTADYDLWLDPDVQDAKRLEPLLVPYTGEAMMAWPVSTMVNNPKADHPRCVKPAVQPPTTARWRSPCGLNWVPTQGSKLIAPSHGAHRHTGPACVCPRHP